MQLFKVDVKLRWAVSPDPQPRASDIAPSSRRLASSSTRLCRRTAAPCSGDGAGECECAAR
eukprot:330178-Pleurochrysis_carterae.AAC.2